MILLSDVQQLEYEVKNAEQTGCFGGLLNALTKGSGMNLFPEEDSADLQNGARLIPYAVTDARRKGKTVTFVKVGDDPKHWYWNIPGQAPVMNPV